MDKNNMSSQKSVIGRYENYMAEIRHRIDVINKVLSELETGSSLTSYREIDIEVIFLQLRHCLELIMFASLSAHYHYGYELSQKILKKEYNATKLLRFIKTKNPSFYPSPAETKPIKHPNGLFEAVPITEGFLTQDDFCRLYDQACGWMLHAQRDNKFNKGHEELIKEATEYRNKLVRLIDCHWISLTDDICLQVLMRHPTTGTVLVMVMQSVESINREIRASG